MSDRRPRSVKISHSSDVAMARRITREFTQSVGFDERTVEEIVISASELAANIVKHAGEGLLRLASVQKDSRCGIQVEAVDKGPGIRDVEEAIRDGFSTADGLGYGLGTVNRLMDEFDIHSGRQRGSGTRVLCTRWVRSTGAPDSLCPLEFGAAARPHPKMAVNGDAFVIARFERGALVGVIDGLGHGQFAHRAAHKASQYVESHADQPLPSIFLGVGRACRATRGVVMALARFDWGRGRAAEEHQFAFTLTFATIGNVEARVVNSSLPIRLLARRGIVGMGASRPLMSQHVWDPRAILVLFSDGIGSHWAWERFRDVSTASATEIAQTILRSLAKDNDDATVVVVRGRGEQCQGT